MIRRQRTSAEAVHCAFDLLELGGDDLRRLPIEQRKTRLAKLLSGAPSPIVLNEHFDGDSAIIYEQPAGSAARVSCRRGSARHTGRSIGTLGEGEESRGAGGHARG